MTKPQIHKVFSAEQVTFILEKYLTKEISLNYALDYLKIGRTRFFHILKEYRNDPDGFTVEYHRQKPTRKIETEIENNILKELSKEKDLIEDNDTPIKHYNYSAVRDTLWDKYGQEVTIISRAKNNNFYLKKPTKKTHEREVITNYVGELLQHDSSYHRWSPLASEKWHLITTLDDYSRFLLYTQLVERETTWAHILGAQSVILQYGCPFKSTKDIFCLRTARMVDSYRRISPDKLELKVPAVPPRQEVEIRMVPDVQRQTVELRIWFQDTLVSRQTVKSQDLKIVQF